MGRRARADTSSGPGWKNLAILVLGVVGAGDLDETGVLPLLFLDRFRENPQCANLKASCEKGPNRAPRSTSGAFAAFHMARVQSARSITITDPARSTALVSSKLPRETAWAKSGATCRLPVRLPPDRSSSAGSVGRTSGRGLPPLLLARSLEFLYRLESNSKETNDYGHCSRNSDPRNRAELTDGYRRPRFRHVVEFRYAVTIGRAKPLLLDESAILGP